MGFALSTMQLRSTSFAAGEAIPRKNSAEGENISPLLAWSDVPEGTKSFAVICHDPDAPRISGGKYGFVHWVLYNLAATHTKLAEGSSQGTAGVNDFGNAGYGGPLPPTEHGTHHYFFIVFALNVETQFEAGLTLWQLFEKIEPHVIGMNRLVGTYRR